MKGDFNKLLVLLVYGNPQGWHLPGGFIEEHDRRIVDKFKGDGQTFTLTTGKWAGASVGAIQEPQCGQNFIDLDGEIR